MFDNIGRKIMTLAKIICWLGIIPCVIVGIALILYDDNLIFAGVLTIVFGAVFSWIGSFLLYGFGQLIENSSIIAKDFVRKNDKHSKKEQKKEEENRKNRFEKIQQMLNDASVAEDEYIDIYCQNCGESLSFTKLDFASNDEMICPVCDAKIVTTIYK